MIELTRYWQPAKNQLTQTLQSAPTEQSSHPPQRRRFVFIHVYDDVLSHISTFIFVNKLSLSMHEWAIVKYKCICFFEKMIWIILECNYLRTLLILNIVIF